MNRLKATIAAAALMAVLLTGCFGSTTATDSSSASSDSASSGETLKGDGAKTADGYDYTLDGFISYMKDNEIISGDGQELTASVIGAQKGQRFISGTNNSPKFTVELYEFAADAESSDEAKKTIEDARKDGSFHLYDSTEDITKKTLAAVTDDGRFLMLYTDNIGNENSEKQQQSAAETVKKFKK